MRHHHDALHMHCICIAWQVSVALQPFLLAVRLVSQPACSNGELRDQFANGNPMEIQWISKLSGVQRSPAESWPLLLFPWEIARRPSFPSGLVKNRNLKPDWVRSCEALHWHNLHVLCACALRMCKACLAILAPSCTSKRHILEHPIPLSFESRSGSAIARKCGRSTCSTRYPALLCRLCLSGLDSNLKQRGSTRWYTCQGHPLLIDQKDSNSEVLETSWDILRLANPFLSLCVPAKEQIGSLLLRTLLANSSPFMLGSCYSSFLFSSHFPPSIFE